MLSQKKKKKEPPPSVIVTGESMTDSNIDVADSKAYKLSVEPLTYNSEELPPKQWRHVNVDMKGKLPNKQSGALPVFERNFDEIAKDKGPWARARSHLKKTPYLAKYLDTLKDRLWRLFQGKDT